MRFGQYLRALREQRHLLLREVAAAANMDTALLSKIERGKRKARKAQVIAVAKALQADPGELHKIWLADQVYTLIMDEDDPTGILKAAEETVKYGQKI